MTDSVVILGCGYTGKRVAARLARRGLRVLATTRHPETVNIEGVTTIQFDALESLGVLDRVEAGAMVVYSIPPLEPDPTERILFSLGDRPTRVVYLSTTGVYGSAVEVNETTPAVPESDAGRARLKIEAAVLSGLRQSLVLRPAAIYGPGRGMHIHIQQGTFRVAEQDADNYVSRIHVEDLAAHIEAALFSDVTGSWPVADECPAPSREVAAFCADLLHVPMPPAVSSDSLPRTRRANRRVDGAAIRKVLGITLQYSSYRTGIPNALGISFDRI